MWQSIRTLDRLLRGEATRPELIEGRTIDTPLVSLAILTVVLAMIYGACMGSYSLFKEVDSNIDWDPDRALQLLASTVKVPALFLLTLVVTLPSLYVFNALVGSQLTLTAVVRLLIASLAVNLAVLASLGPIVAFFSVSTKSYPFMVLFNVAVFTVSGVLGLTFLVQTLNRLSIRRRATAERWEIPEIVEETEQPASEGETTTNPGPKNSDTEGPSSGEGELTLTPDYEQLGPLDAVTGHVLGRHVKTVFRCWVVLFALVGVQMGWVLRPFIGSPDQPFTWFREREANFFLSVWNTLVSLFSSAG